jgi:hypothetical protein
MDKPRARFPEVKLPHINDRPVFEAVQELKKAGAALKDVDIVHGQPTAEMTLGALGTTHRIKHNLSRAAKGWIVAWQVGFEPRYRVLDSDARHITIVSLDQVDVCGTFATDGAGAVTTGAQYLWSAAHVGAAGSGVYRVTMSFEASQVLSAEAKSTSLNSVPEMRVTATSGAGPTTVDFTNYSGPATADLVSLSVHFRASVTGTAPRLKWWVY